MKRSGAVFILAFVALLASCQGLSGSPGGIDPRENVAEFSPTAAGGSTFPERKAGSSVATSSIDPVRLADLLSTATPASPFSQTTTQPAFSGLCSDDLTYMGDLTYPDKVKVLAGQPLEKRWKVRNSGTCDWGPDYRFRWISGSLPATQAEQALNPAVGGSEAVVAIRLTAPAAEGEYISWWQAVSPSGVLFGDMLSVDLIVTP